MFLFAIRNIQHIDLLGLMVTAVFNRKTKSFWLIKTNVGNLMNQSKLEANTCNRCQARKIRILKIIF